MPVRWGEATYGEDSYSGHAPEDDGSDIPFEKPWRINNIRIEDIHSDNGLPVPVDGRESSYEIYLEDYVDGAASLGVRYENLIRYIRDGDNVITYKTPRGTYFRNQAGVDQLILLKPLKAGEIAQRADPETRDSPWPARWAVVTGGEDNSRFPEGYVQMTLNTVTIALERNYPTRELVKATWESSDI